MLRFFYPECCSERKLSVLTLKLRAVRPLDQYNSTERTKSARTRREDTSVTGEDGDAARSEREELVKTKNASEENGVDLFR